MAMEVSADVKSAELQAVVIRADGTKEDLGTIAYYQKNPIKRVIKKIRNGH